MILVVTDGVELTTEIVKTKDRDEKRELFKRFYQLQLDALCPYACRNKHWNIIKTTGDGLLLGIDDQNCACNEDAGSAHQQVIEAIHAMYHNFKKTSFQIRCVCHSTNEPIDDISIFQDKYANLLSPSLLKQEVFGLEVIRLMRIAANVKGQFWLITKDFLKALLNSPDTDQQINDKLKYYNGSQDKIEIDSDAIPLPYLKGFEKEVMQTAVVNLRNPCFVWEVKPLQFEMAV